MPTAEPLLTVAARRHAAKLARAIAPDASRLERRCRALLKRRGHCPAVRRGLLAIAPSALAQQISLDQFLEEVEYQGRRLAKHNLSPVEVRAVLSEMEALLDPIAGERFAPSREQLHLATVLVLDRAYCQVREAEAQALFGIYRAEAEARDGDSVLRRVAAVLTRTFRAKAARVLTGPGLDPRLSRLLFIKRGTPGARLIADAGMREQYRSYWSCPLHNSAVLQLGFAVEYPWLPRERLLLEIAAERCRGALERVRLEAENHRLAAEARCAEEEERRRIGRELHDETGQSLLTLRLQLEMMEKKAQGSLGARLQDARRLVEGTIVELRRLMAALSPTAVERLGMAASLRHLVSRFRKMHPAVMRVRMMGQLEAIPKPIQAVVYRVAQECLQNAIKHSHASAIKLSLSAADKRIRLRISDNGTGFRSGVAAGKPMSFGLAGMRERAALLGGTLAVSSVPDKGTMVILELPLNAAMVAENVQNSCTVD